MKLKKTTEELNNAIIDIKKYDEKVHYLEKNMVNIVSRLDEVRNDYHKVSTSVEIVETDLTKFDSKIDLLNTNLDKIKEDSLKVIKSNLNEIKQSISENNTNFQANINLYKIEVNDLLNKQQTEFDKKIKIIKNKFNPVFVFLLILLIVIFVFMFKDQF